MKRSTKIILTGLMAVLTCVTLLLGCTPQEAIAPVENYYSKEFGGFTTHPQDPRMTIDGVLDEALWEGKAWFTNVFMHDVNGVYPKFKVTGFPTDYGIYVAAFTDDTNITNNGQRSANVQSVFEFEITADNVGEYRVDDGLHKTKYVFDMRGDVYSRNPNVDRAVVVNGEINSGKTQGATLEFFISWEELHVDVSKGVPEEFRMQCTYKACLPGRENLNYDMVSTSYTSILTRDFFRFGKDGYVTVDREDAKIGDSFLGHNKTANWDISKEAEGVVRSSGGSYKHMIFFKEHYGSDFIIETTVVPVKSLGDAYPKAGIYLQTTNSYNSNYADYCAIVLDCQDIFLVDGPDGTKNFKTYKMGTMHMNGGWKYIEVPGSGAITNPNASTQEGVKLTVVKNGSTLIYFCNDQFIAEVELDFLDTEILPGFYSLGMDAIFKDSTCEAVDEEGLKDYLGGKGVYMIDAMARGVQGTVTASKSTVTKGESVDITITTKPGYRVSSVMINGEEKLADVQANAVDGVYTISDINSHQEIRVGFEKVDGVQFAGVITDGTTPITADVKLSSTTDGSLCYSFIVEGAKGFDIKVPTGTYKLAITSLGYKALVKEITISGDMNETYALEESEFLTTVKVNNSVVSSKVDKWDLTYVADGKISTSYLGGGKDQPLYFKTPATDFAAEITADYITEFVSGNAYQLNLMAGFQFNDGKKTGFLVVDYTGYRFGWDAATNKMNLLPDRVLTYYPDLGYLDPTPATFGIAKVGDEVHIFIDGKFIATEPWSAICPGLDPNKDVAIGMIMIADKEADLEISNYKLMTGTEAAQDYINAHK